MYCFVFKAFLVRRADLLMSLGISNFQVTFFSNTDSLSSGQPVSVSLTFSLLKATCFLLAFSFVTRDLYPNLMFAEHLLYIPKPHYSK